MSFGQKSSKHSMKYYVLEFSHVWSCHKTGQGQSKVIICTILVVLQYPMLHIEIQGNQSIGLREEDLYSTLVISTSVISNNCLSRRENLVLVLTQKSKIRLQNIVEKKRNCSWGAISPLFHNIFSIYFKLKESNYIVICKIWLFKLFFPQYYKSDMSKYGFLEVFMMVPLISNKESRL